MKFDYLSVSRVKLYQKCPKAYWYRYIQKVSDGKTFYALPFGAAIHKVFDAFLLGDTDISNLITIYNDAYDTCTKDKVITFDYLTEEDLLPMAIEMIQALITQWQPPKKIVAIEKEVHGKIGNYNFLGIIDAFTPNHFIEFKTARFLNVRYDLQIGTYGYITQLPALYIILSKPPNPKVQVEYIDPSQHYDWCIEEFQKVGKGIESDEFPKTNNCKYCGYKSICQETGS